MGIGNVTMDRDTFFAVYMGRVHPRRALLTGKMSVARMRFNELSHFAEAFDVSTDKWVQFYRYRATLGGSPPNPSYWAALLIHSLIWFDGM
jgi:hypothetical protein